MAQVLSSACVLLQRARTGESVSRMTNDTGVIKTLVSEHIASLFTGVISIVGSISVLLYLNWKMTLVLFTVLPLSALILEDRQGYAKNISGG